MKREITGCMCESAPNRLQTSEHGWCLGAAWGCLFDVLGSAHPGVQQRR